MWRPSNWEETIIGIARYHISTEIYDKQELKIARKFFVAGVEAGADTILKELKQYGKHTDGKAPTLSINVLPEQSGWLVFIPDDYDER